MKLSKILRILWAILWRISLIAVTLAVLVSVGIGMVLDTIFNGPSPAARNALVMTMLEHAQTASIPSYFLDEALIRQISEYECGLRDTTSDPFLIERADNGRALQETVHIGERTAIITLSYRVIPFESTSGECYAGVDSSGVLILSFSEDKNLEQRCEKILILNGQYDTGLYDAQPSYGPRLAIGQTADGAFIRVVMDCGTYQELIDIMTAYGAMNACALSSDED